MTPREFLDMVVRPNVVAFHAQPDDYRLAYNAVTSIDALAAQLYVWCTINAPTEVAGISREDDGYREHLAGQHGDFGLLRDVAKAQKHVRLTKGHPRVQSAGQMVAREVGHDEVPFDTERFDALQVVVDDNAGTTTVVEYLVDSVIDSFDQKLAALGL